MLAASGQHDLRAAPWAKTIGQVLKSVATAIVVGVATLLGAGRARHQPRAAAGRRPAIAGVAIGFGAQSLVKDFLSGVFMLLEDQYGVGDVIDVGRGHRHRRAGDACGRPGRATSRAPSGTSPTARSAGSATRASSGPGP